MAKIHYSPKLAQEYQELFEHARPRPQYQKQIQRQTEQLQAQQHRYQAVAEPLAIPWLLVGLIHQLESGQNFSRHLHNGDPLTARTKQVPAGRPLTGEPPFSWEDSARDALMLRHLHQQSDWSLPRLLYELEGYNGWGYRLHHPKVLSPYLWSYSTLYDRGKYVEDGLWSDSARSQQCGAAIVLKQLLLAQPGLISLTPATRPQILPRFSLTHPASPSELQRAYQLQRWLNTQGNQLKIDGICGRQTSDAYFQQHKAYLKGDPKALQQQSA